MLVWRAGEREGAAYLRCARARWSVSVAYHVDFATYKFVGLVTSVGNFATVPTSSAVCGTGSWFWFCGRFVRIISIFKREFCTMDYGTHAIAVCALLQIASKRNTKFNKGS
eukprot:IDg10101t1